MYKELMISLKEKGVIFDQGISEKEISCIEKEYKLSFPKEWKQFYSIALPISVGFYN